MADLVLGPMVRYVGTTEATVWVETNAPCEVEILGQAAPSFRVADRHYALVALTGLEPGSSSEYEARLDGRLCWPSPYAAFPPSRIQTLPRSGAISVAWGSCRVAAPEHPPYTLSPDEHRLGIGVDVLSALALRLRTQEPTLWPRMLLLIGDQVYADAVRDFAGYTRLYRAAWSPPALRWLLSTVPSAMIFDDHDVHDDWNISASWTREMRDTPWWEEKIAGALASYWIYQHLGNLSPVELARDRLYQRVLETDDAAPVLREFALAADRQDGGGLWSYSRRIGGARLLVLDTREGRVLDGERRQMLDEQQWSWLEQELIGDCDHVLVASTLPVLLAPALHYLEAWSEAVCDGRWGRLAARAGERLRRVLDLEHWPAFEDSFHRLIALVEQVATGDRGTAPASIVLLGGDVHHAYVERVGFKLGRGADTAVYQVVCSPFRNLLGRRYRTALTVARRSRAVQWLVHCAARLAGVREPRIRWKPIQEPTFYNHLGWLEIDGRSLGLTIEYTRSGEEPQLHVLCEQRLA